MRLFPDLWPFGDLQPHSFDFIMADPPWRFEVRSEKGEGKSAQRHYQTMSLDEINGLPVLDLAAENCTLWLWCTAPMLSPTIEDGRRLGIHLLHRRRLGEDDEARQDCLRDRLRPSRRA